MFQGYERYSSKDIQSCLFESQREQQYVEEEKRIQKIKDLLRKGQYEKANSGKVELPLKRDPRMRSIVLKQLERRGEIASLKGLDLNSSTYERPSDTFLFLPDNCSQRNGF